MAKPVCCFFIVRDYLIKNRLLLEFLVKPYLTEYNQTEDSGRYIVAAVGGFLYSTEISFSSFSFGLFPIRGRYSRYLHFYDMAFVLRSDDLPATNPLFRGKTGPCLPRKGGGVSLNVLPKDTTSKLAGLFSTLSLFYDESQAGKL